MNLFKRLRLRVGYFIAGVKPFAHDATSLRLHLQLLGKIQHGNLGDTGYAFEMVLKRSPGGVYGANITKDEIKIPAAMKIKGIAIQAVPEGI